jgi:hypothetical protein
MIFTIAPTKNDGTIKTMHTITANHVCFRISPPLPTHPAVVVWGSPTPAVTKLDFVERFIA